jgi:hypothetical protein
MLFIFWNTSVGVTLHTAIVVLRNRMLKLTGQQPGTPNRGPRHSKGRLNVSLMPQHSTANDLAEVKGRPVTHGTDGLGSFATDLDHARMAKYSEVL